MLRWAASIVLSDVYYHILAVRGSAIRSVHSPLDIHQGHGGGDEHGGSARDYHAHVHRQLAHQGAIVRGRTQPLRVGYPPLLQAGSESEFPQVGSSTGSGFHIPRLQVSDSVTPGVSHYETLRQSGPVTGQFSDQQVPHSYQKQVGVEASLAYRDSLYRTL